MLKIANDDMGIKLEITWESHVVKLHRQKKEEATLEPTPKNGPKQNIYPGVKSILLTKFSPLVSILFKLHESARFATTYLTHSKQKSPKYV